MRWGIVLVLMAMPALAEGEPDCRKLRKATQSDLSYCAAQDFKKADKALDEMLIKMKAQAEANDKGTEKTEFVDALAASQKAWLAFRDAECAWQAMEMHGGTGEPMLTSMCLAHVTKNRIIQLQTGVSE